VLPALAQVLALITRGDGLKGYVVEDLQLPAGTSRIAVGRAQRDAVPLHLQGPLQIPHQLGVEGVGDGGTTRPTIIVCPVASPRASRFGV
jgi:hypothetical protein